MMRKMLMQAVLAASVTVVCAGAAWGAGATGGAGGVGTSGPGPAAGGAGAGDASASRGMSGPTGAPLPSGTGPSTAITPQAGSANPELNDRPNATPMPRPGEPDRAARDRRTPGVPPPILPRVGESGGGDR
jgi:hypothetical protein